MTVGCDVIARFRLNVSALKEAGVMPEAGTETISLTTMRQLMDWIATQSIQALSNGMNLPNEPEVRKRAPCDDLDCSRFVDIAANRNIIGTSISKA